MLRFIADPESFSISLCPSGRNVPRDALRSVIFMSNGRRVLPREWTQRVRLFITRKSLVTR